MSEVIHYWRNPGLRIPKKLPQGLLRELDSFIESESTDREARIAELAELCGVSVHDILEQIKKLEVKK